MIILGNIHDETTNAKDLVEYYTVEVGGGGGGGGRF